MERETIKLNAQQHSDICNESFLEIDGNEIAIKEVKTNHLDTRRHTELYEMIFKRESDNKFFKVLYETSIKDSMGWDDCNFGDSFEAVEVFPKVIETTIYE